ncbi:hypothetical protein [Caulobacter sp. SSI4214]|uniref:hypothetical protein n=1 Tax=Caulobacter sp. SSI4214 TaxID=2575739 RepID=UPI00143BAAE1|nr:hypothetical protein [Caulobacter sp. SSI4214]
MAEFLLVTLNTRGGEIDEAMLHARFDKALDWIKYAPNCWILYTTKDSKTWYERVRKVVGERAHIFVVEVNLKHRAGWLPKSVWAWIAKDRSKS